MRDTILQTPLWQQIVVIGEDGGLKSVFDLVNVYADIFSGDHWGLRHLDSSRTCLFVGRENFKKHETKWIDRNVPSC